MVAPHLAEELFTSEHARGTAREVGEQVELGGREVHGLAAELHSPRLEVDADATEVH